MRANCIRHSNPLPYIMMVRTIFFTLNVTLSS